MSLVPVFTDVKNQLLAQVANTPPFTQAVNANNTLPFVQMWNNQFAAWVDRMKEPPEMQTSTEKQTYGVNYPAILIEFDHLENMQLGNGNQLYDDLTVRLHIIHEQLDAGDGTMEQNLTVYTLADAVYLALQLFRPAGCVEFIRQRHGLDWNHGNLYHYILEFGTNYMDILADQPIDGVTIPGDTITPEITITPE